MVTPVRLEPAAPRSWFKHSNTEPLCSFDTLVCGSFVIYLILYRCIFVLPLDIYLGSEGRKYCFTWVVYVVIRVSLLVSALISLLTV